MDLDVTFLFQLGIFLVCLVGLNGLILKPFLAVIQEREAKTAMIGQSTRPPENTQTHTNTNTRALHGPSHVWGGKKAAATWEAWAESYVQTDRQTD